MMKKNIISHSELLNYCDYCKKSGKFTYKKDKMSYNYKKILVKAGGEIKHHISSQGYLKCLIKGKEYGLHMLAVYYVTGAYPVNRVKIIDGNKRDIKYNNLKLMTPKEKKNKKKEVERKVSDAAKKVKKKEEKPLTLDEKKFQRKTIREIILFTGLNTKQRIERGMV
jgi:hypothetical protein